VITLSDDDDLFGSSGKYRSISFKGSPVIEYKDLQVLERQRKTQSRDPQTGEPKFFKHKSGPLAGQPDTSAPIWQWVIKVKLPAGFRPDKDIEKEYGEDDGERFLYVGGKADPSSRSSRAALIAALRKAGVKAVEPGGVLNRFAFVAEGVAASRAFNPPKFYEAAYTPPAPGSNGSAGFWVEDRPSEVDDDEPPF
jgi:hypothetical protein